VGALLVEPHDRSCQFGVIFFNNVGYLGMCGHGTIGLLLTLGHLGRTQPGTVRIETPVGIVEAVWHGGNAVSVTNVPSYRRARDVAIEVPGIGVVKGDVAWGGNWFYLVSNHREEIVASRVDQLTDVAWRIRQAVNAAGFPEVDHVELFGPAQHAEATSRNFVLCPGKAYDRSPCGTGTSAKLACLAADGRLDEGESWVQESVIGSVFRGSYRWLDRDQGTIAPTITGTAFLTAETTLLLDPRDPFYNGISHCR
jgi:proline racemase